MQRHEKHYACSLGKDECDTEGVRVDLSADQDAEAGGNPGDVDANDGCSGAACCLTVAAVSNLRSAIYLPGFFVMDFVERFSATFQ